MVFMDGTLKRNTKDLSSLEVDNSDYTLGGEFKSRGKGLVRVQKSGLVLGFLPFQVSAGRKAAYE